MKTRSIARATHLVCIPGEGENRRPCGQTGVLRPHENEDQCKARLPIRPVQQQTKSLFCGCDTAMVIWGWTDGTILDHENAG